MDDNDKLFQITESGKFDRLVVKSIVVGVLGLFSIITMSGYGCNHQDNIAKIETAKSDAIKSGAASEVERTKLEVEKSRLDLERAILERSPSR